MDAGLTPAEAYCVARAHCVQTWHGIIREDILKRFIHKDIAGEAAKLVWELTEPTLLAGLFRAFHAMPLSSYTRMSGETHNLAALRKEGYETSEAEKSRWFFDWEFFLGVKEGGPRTGISASISRGLNGPTMGLPAIDCSGREMILRQRGSLVLHE